MEIGVIVIVAIIVIIGVFVVFTKIKPQSSSQDTDEVKSTKIHVWSNQTESKPSQTESQSSSQDINESQSSSQDINESQSKTLELLEGIHRNTLITANIIIIFTILSFLGVIISIVS